MVRLIPGLTRPLGSSFRGQRPACATLGLVGEEGAIPLPLGFGAGAVRRSRVAWRWNSQAPSVWKLICPCSQETWCYRNRGGPQPKWTFCAVSSAQPDRGFPLRRGQPTPSLAAWWHHLSTATHLPLVRAGSGSCAQPDPRSSTTTQHPIEITRRQQE